MCIRDSNMGVDGKGLGLLLENEQVSKVLASYVGENKLFAEQYLNGTLDVEFVPQGTLAERMRAGGAGIPAFYTPTGVGTPIAEGKEEAVFDGKRAILERGIVADIALVRAHTGDLEGNLRYRLTSRNFNPLTTTCGRITLAEVETLSDEYLDSERIDTQGVFVQRIVPVSYTHLDVYKRQVGHHLDLPIGALLKQEQHDLSVLSHSRIPSISHDRLWPWVKAILRQDSPRRYQIHPRSLRLDPRALPKATAKQHISSTTETSKHGRN